MLTTSTTRRNGSRRLGTGHIQPHSYVAFKIDPYASLAVLGDPMTDFYTKDLLGPEHSKVYLGLVLEAQRLVGCGRYQLTLSVIGPRPATLSQDDASTLVPIISSAALYNCSITRYPVFPTLPLLSGLAYHYPKVIRVIVSAIIFPEDSSLFPRGFPKLGKDDVERLKKYAAHDARQMARRINGPNPDASQAHQVMRDLQPMDMAAEIAQVKAAIQEAPWGAFDPETPSERHDRLRLLDCEMDPTLSGGILHWEPVVTVWVNHHEAGDSLTLPEMLDTEIALLKRVADIFNRRWIEWVRAVYVQRSTKPLFLPPIYDRQGPKPSRTEVILKDSVPPSGPVTRYVPPSELATRDVTTEHHLESSQGGEKSVAADAIIPLRVVPVPARPHRINHPDRRACRLRDARAAINRLTTAAKFVGKGVRLATIGSYYAAKFSIKAVRYVVTKSLTLTGRTSRVGGRPRVRPRPFKSRIYKPQPNPQQHQ